MTLPATTAPVITIDGPTASGKGSVADGVAKALGFHVLDSGALYRLTALDAERHGIDLDDEAELAARALALEPTFTSSRIFMDDRDVTDEIRAERVGNLASAIAPFPALRAALLDRQRAFQRPPGLVADGRDMGTIVFPEAALKIFLVAGVAARAERRHRQLMERGMPADLDVLLRELHARDARDAGRKVAPLVAAADAITIDSSNLGLDEVIATVLVLAGQRGIGSSAG
jgi:cytidylate kinase